MTNLVTKCQSDVAFRRVVKDSSVKDIICYLSMSCDRRRERFTARLIARLSERATFWRVRNPLQSILVVKLATTGDTQTAAMVGIKLPWKLVKPRLPCVVIYCPSSVTGMSVEQLMRD